MVYEGEREAVDESYAYSELTPSPPKKGAPPARSPPPSVDCRKRREAASLEVASCSCRGGDDGGTGTGGMPGICSVGRGKQTRARRVSRPVCGSIQRDTHVQRAHLESEEASMRHCLESHESSTAAAVRGASEAHWG